MACFLPRCRDFHEHLVNKLLNGQTCKPRWMAIDVIMNPRGGIATTVSAEYSRSKQ
jgi:NADPH-dependent 7-cyano-7-deazaguanine reductase QueF